MTMPPLAPDPEASRPYFRRLRELAESRGLRELSMGTSQDYAVGVEEGATHIRVGSILWTAASLPPNRTETTNIPASMGLADVWSRTLVYFGIAEEDDGRVG